MNGVKGDATSDDNDNNGNISTLGLCTGILVKHRAKLELVDNFIQRCDVGIYIGKHSPTKVPHIPKTIVVKCYIEKIWIVKFLLFSCQDKMQPL